MTKKAPTLSEFRCLCEDLQMEILQRDGVFVGKRIVNGKTLILFQLYTFYVEVHYQLYRKEISRLVISSDVDILAPYMDQIHIRDLDKNNRPKQG
jgi:hypothetical protein